MSVPLKEFVHFTESISFCRDLPRLFKLSCIVALVLTVICIGRRVIDGQANTMQFAVAITYLLTLFAFSVGDTGIINTSNLAASKSGHRRVVWDTLLVLFHAILLNLLALLSVHDSFKFLCGMMFLCFVNDLWLALKVMQFNRIHERSDDAILKKRISRCRSAMLKWMVINTMFGMMLSTLLFHAKTVHSVHWLCVGIVFLRTAADISLCHRYYNDVLSGYFSQKPSSIHVV